MRILITGGRGQLGRELVRALTGNELFRLGLPEVDIQDPGIIQTILDAEPEVVIHAAALTDVDACELDPERAYRINATGTKHVAEAASRLTAKLVYISTDYVFDGTKQEPYAEEDRPNPINAYGRSKLEGERAVLSCAPGSLIVRTAWLYGEGARNFVSSILRLARANRTLRVVDDQVGSPTSARDLAAVIRALVDLGTSGIIHAAGKGACSRYELAQAIVAMAALGAEVLPATSDTYPRPARRPAYCPLAQHRLNQLGLCVPPWTESLKEFLKLFGAGSA
jgi:dTDP-4-dehydrorhamnose reductase